MARFYAVQIDSIYLTSDGTSAGDKCKLEIPGVEDLLMSVAGSAIATASGRVVMQTVEWTKGKVFDIRVETLMKDVWEDLKTLINDALDDDSDFEITGTGDIGNFTVTVKPFPQKPFSAASFINERIKAVNLRFITV
jgi:hypothetical protein